MTSGARPAGAALIFAEPFTVSPSNTTGTSNWKIDSAGASPSYVASGGPAGVGDGYISRQGPTTIGGQGTAVFRGQDNFASSNNGFVRNWISDGVTNFSIDVFQNSGTALTFFLRLATPNNSPAASTNPFTVQTGIWTNINIPIVDSATSFQSYEGGTFTSVFSSIGKIQLFQTLPSAAGTVVNIDNPTITGVPEPTSLALIGAVSACGLLMYRRRRCAS